MPRRKLTQHRLKELLDYNPVTGIFRWRVGGNGRQKDMQAGSAVRNGRIGIRVDCRRYYASRLAWLYVYGIWPSEVDHINADASDNRISNLREATRCQNTYNIKRKSNNTSGFKGVSPYRGRWRARIQANRQPIFLGMFATRKDAVVAYRDAARSLHGEFARVT